MAEAKHLLRPMLRPGVLYRSLAEGVDFRLADRGFRLRSNLDFALVHRLVGLLNGRRPLREIEEALPPKVKPVFDLIFKNLTVYDLVIEGPSGRYPEQDQAAPIISLLQDTSDDWERGLSAWRCCSITINAPDDVINTLLQSLDHAGVGKIRIMQRRDSAITAAAIAAAGISAPVTVETAEQLLSGPPDRNAVLLSMHSQGDDPDPLIDAIDRVHGATIPAVIFTSGALVGSVRRSGLKDWLDVCETLAVEGEQLSLSGAKVAAALMVFEALHCIASAPADGLRLRDQLTLVRADGTSRPVSLDALLASRRITMKTGMERPVAVLKDERVAWRDHEVGPFKLVPPPGPGYPLAHCGYEVTASVATAPLEPAVVWGWGLSTKAAEHRAMRRACDQLALLRQPAIDPLLLATAADQASATLLLHAQRQIRSADAERMDWQAIDFSQLGADDQILERLAHLYWNQWPELHVCRIDDRAWIARAKLGAWTVVSIEVSSAAAISEALGEAVSTCQMGLLSSSQLRAQAAWKHRTVTEGSASHLVVRLLDDAPPGFCTAYLCAGAD